jgi:succinoglycan biosynthesis transport protein ExoP
MHAETQEPSYHRLSNPEVDLQPSESALHEHSDVREFLVLLRRHAILIVVVTIATAAATFLATLNQPKQYASDTTLLYAPTATATGGQDPTRAIDTIVGVGTSDAVLEPVATQAQIPISTLKSSIGISGDPNADLIRVSAVAGTASQAAAIANDVARALISYNGAGQKKLLNAQITSLQRQLQAFAGRTDPSAVAAASDLRTQLAEAGAQLTVARPDLSVLTPAAEPTTATSPHPKRNAAIGILVGLVLGVMLGMLRDRLDRRIRGLDEVESIYRAPMLGMVPFMKGRHSRADMLADFSDTGPLADAYRTIRTNLALFRLNNQETSVIVVTSAVSEEGKSAVAANLAHALSVIGKNVLAVGADLHNPSLHEYFEVPPTHESPGRIQRVGPAGAAWLASAGRTPAGLVQVLAGEVSLADAVRIIPLTPRERAGGGSLAVLADSSTFFDPAVLFSSRPMDSFLAQARQHYDVIILDTPPLLANADAPLLGQGADVLVLVARLEHLTKNQARRAVRIMAASRLAATGVIVTGDVDEPDYGYGYRYERFDNGTAPTAEERTRTSV